MIVPIAKPDASDSRQPRAPHVQRRPPGSTMMWPTLPALPVAPSTRSPSSTSPPSTCVDTTIVQKLWAPRAAPSQPSASVVALASRSPNTGKPGQLAQVLAQLEPPPRRHAHRRDRLAVALDRSGAPDADRPHPHVVLVARPVALLGRRCRASVAKCDCGPTSGSTSAAAAIEQLAAERHDAGREAATFDRDREDRVTRVARIASVGRIAHTGGTLARVARCRAPCHRRRQPIGQTLECVNPVVRPIACGAVGDDPRGPPRPFDVDAPPLLRPPPGRCW